MRTKITESSRGRIGNGRGPLARRAAIACGVAALSAVTLAACGGPSATVVANQTLKAGIAAQRAGDYRTAAADYSKVLKSEPKNVYALYDLGDVEQFQHRDTAAAKRYNEVLAINPTFENALYNMAILESQSDPTAAKALFLEVIAQSPNDAVARLDLGRVLLGLGETSEAESQIARAISLDPSLKNLTPTS